MCEKNVAIWSISIKQNQDINEENTEKLLAAAAIVRKNIEETVLIITKEHAIKTETMSATVYLSNYFTQPPLIPG